MNQPALDCFALAHDNAQKCLDEIRARIEFALDSDRGDGSPLDIVNWDRAGDMARAAHALEETRDHLCKSEEYAE